MPRNNLLRTSRLVIGITLTLALLMLTIGVPVIAAKNGGNSVNAKMCQKGGWMDLQRADGTHFTTARECTNYGAQGGTLEAKVTELLDQWQIVTTSSIGGGTQHPLDQPYGQTFTAGISGQLTSTALYPGSSQQGWTLELRSVAGGLPTSTVLASTTITSSASNAWVKTTFATPALVTAGTQYAIVIVAPVGMAIKAGGANDHRYAGGGLVITDSDTGTVWAMFAGFDLAFETYVTP